MIAQWVGAGWVLWFLVDEAVRWLHTRLRPYHASAKGGAR